MNGKMVFQFWGRVKKDGEWYVSHCPMLDVWSQGGNEQEALENLADACSLFLVSCFERGVLDKALRDCGVKPVKVGKLEKSEKRTAKGMVPFEVLIPYKFKQSGRVACHA